MLDPEYREVSRGFSPLLIKLSDHEYDPIGLVSFPLQFRAVALPYGDKLTSITVTTRDICGGFSKGNLQLNNRS
ncbi:hypothetical protein FOZ62_000295, partial [Perkinsus olseni]